MNTIKIDAFFFFLQMFEEEECDIPTAAPKLKGNELF